jgi:hypothetical protein
MGPCDGVDYNLTLCPLQRRLQLQHIYHGQPYARIDLNPMPESTLSPQSGTLDLASARNYLTALGSLLMPKLILVL